MFQTDRTTAPSPTTVVTGPSNASNISVGFHPVTYLVTDESGNTASCQFNITVLDTQPPTISCPNPMSTNASSNACATTVSYNTPVGHDNCPASVTSLVAGYASGSSFYVGSTVINYSVVDASGNEAYCTFSVTVNDVTPPVITSCPSSTTQLAGDGVCSYTYSYVVPTVTDHVERI